MQGYKEQIDKNHIPLSIAIIMDGNGRWAKERHKERIFGHENGVNSVRNACEACAELGVKVLTLYTFSKENWQRPKEEVDALMQMLVVNIANEEKTLMDNDISLKTIGDTDALPNKTKEALYSVIEKTQNNKRMDLVLALNYSSRWEIVEATKSLAKKVRAGEIDVEDIDEKVFSANLQTKNYPDPDLLIRTSGEERISNYLLWQIAYTELYFTDVLWPDFSKEDLYKAIVTYEHRQRRFGKTASQIEDSKK